MNIPSGLEENLWFTSYRHDPVIGKYFVQARFYGSVNIRKQAECILRVKSRYSRSNG